MQKKIIAEGEKEKELYEKFMCYCKSRGGALGKSIADANTKIPEVQSDIEAAEAQKVQLEADVKKAQADKAAAKTAMAEATAVREKEAAAFASEKAGLDSDVSAMLKAIAALEKGMTGGFLQTSAANVLRRLAVTAQISDFNREMLTSFLSAGAADGYAPQSGEIVGILKQMTDTMNGDINDLIAAENNAIKIYEALMAAKTKEVNVLTKAIEEKLVRIGQLGVEIVNMKEDLSDTEAALIEDTKFLEELKTGCATKTQEWEERSATRTLELAALADAIKVLNDDDALELFKKTLPGASSLVQVAAGSKELRQRALALVRDAEKKVPQKSRAALELVALALGGKGGSFAKVIKMIDDMVALLKKEQVDDDSKKEYCDVQIDSTEDAIKELDYEITGLGNAIDDMTSGIAALADEIAALGEGIVALDKAVAEATAARKDEHEDYVELMASNTAAKQLIGIAKNRLNKFYNPKLFKPAPKRELSEDERITLNMGGTMAPTNAPGGIAGTGVAVFAQVANKKKDAPAPPPETWGAYGKKGEESGGVIAMMDALIADLDKEMTEAETEEKLAQEEYVKLMADSASKRTGDAKTMQDKTAAKAGMEGDLVKAKGERKDKTRELMATEKYLSGLHAECDWLLKNFDLRKEARAGEVDALKSAKAVLSGADYSFIQPHKPVTRHLRA